MYGIIFLALFFVPIGVLGWRVVVSKTRKQWRRIGAAAAATISTVGAFVVAGDLANFDFKDWRSDVALFAACLASLYLLSWARGRGNRRHRSISVLAAIIGLVPVLATIALTLLFRE